MVGDEMRRGVSGGQKKRVTTGTFQGTSISSCKLQVLTSIETSVRIKYCAFFTWLVDKHLLLYTASINI